MIQFLTEKINNGELPVEYDTIRFLDLGTGNGHLLFEMSEEFDEEIELDTQFVYKGIDYSPDSVEFASKINEKKYNSDAFSFEQVDLLAKESQFLKENAEKFDILLDKGTLDAIALNQDPIDNFDGKIGQEVYGPQVYQLMHSGSILLITSCNFTEEELVKIITKDTDLKVWDKINYPSFEFGGVKGSTICSIAFIKP